MSTADLKKMKRDGTPIAMVTAYDYPSAKLAEEAGADMLLVGDSLGMVVLGYDSTLPVTMDDMVHHTKAVSRAAKSSFVLADLPFASYHGSADKIVGNAARLIQEGRAQAVKMEGGAEICEAVKLCVSAGIPVSGHIGLTPQAVNNLGGYRVQGRRPEEAQKLIDDAKALEQAGVFCIVLEMVPEELAAWITSELSVPTIGIGAGRGCDGQVLVYHDLLQYASPISPRFVKTYADIGEQVKAGLTAYVSEVKNRQFPAKEHVFQMDGTILEQLKQKAGEAGQTTEGQGER